MATLSNADAAIAQALIAYAAAVPPADLFPTATPESRGFAVSDPFAFALGVCLDRQTKAEIVWTIPFDMKVDLGHLDPERVRALGIDGLAEVFGRLPRRPRFVNDAPRTIFELSTIVSRELGGDASLLWKGKTAAEVKQAFLRIHGVGNGIANMAVLLIEQAFRFRFAELDRPTMDIKADRQTMRVLYRLGVSAGETVDAATAAARRLNPAFPGAIDSALWRIGRGFCHPQYPDCPACPVGGLCVKRGVTRNPQPYPLYPPAPSGENAAPTRPTAMAQQPLPPAPAPAPAFQMTASNLGEMRRALLRVLDQIDPNKTPGELAGARLSRLTGLDLIPPVTSHFMRMVLFLRNLAEYESVTPTPSESDALLGNWRSVTAWAEGEGLTIERLPFLPGPAARGPLKAVNGLEPAHLPKGAGWATTVIREKLEAAGGWAMIPKEKGPPFRASLAPSGGGVQVSNLGQQPFLPWAAFEESVALLRSQDGRAVRGDAMGPRLGSIELPLDSIEGHIAHKVYGVQPGAAVFRRITPIAGILAWAGICVRQTGALALARDHEAI